MANPLRAGMEQNMEVGDLLSPTALGHGASPAFRLRLRLELLFASSRHGDFSAPQR